MGLGSTAKKVQLLAERAEQLYTQVGELREQLVALRSKVDETHETVTGLERRQGEQAAVLEAIARELDVDVEAVREAASPPVDAEDEADEAAGSEHDGEGSDETITGTDEDADQGRAD